MGQQGSHPLLEHIPEDRLSPRQKAFLPPLESERVYKMLQEPTHISHSDWKAICMLTIWRTNGTLICFSHITKTVPAERCVSLRLWHVGQQELLCTVYGETDAAVVDTVMYIWSLHCPESRASRTFWLEFSRDRFAFVDKGTAFVDALEKRESVLGEMGITFKGKATCMSSENLKRLLKLEIFDSLVIHTPTDKACVLLPFAAKVRDLSYTLNAASVQPADFHHLDIPTRNITLHLDGLGFDDEIWDALLIAFLNRVAVLGHFEQLHVFNTDYSDSYEHVLADEDDEPYELEDAEPVVEALIRAIRGNPKLFLLGFKSNRAFHALDPSLAEDLHGNRRASRTLHFQTAVQPIGVRFGKVESEDFAFLNKYGFGSSCLEQLLSRNRNIVVLDFEGRNVTNGTTIDKIYSLNRFYNGSVGLKKESTALRPLLVATALTASALNNVQYTALLLSDHTDVLCEWFHSV